MIIHSTSDSSSVFTDGKLKPGIYRIQNIAGHTYLDIRDESKELCCRPITVLEGKGLWEILPLGSGYSIRRLEQEKPEQYCIMLKGLESESVVSVSPFPVAWRIEIVEDERFRGCEYVRMFWGTTNMTWDLRDFGSHKDRTRVQLKKQNHGSEPCRVWKLTPATLDAGSKPAREKALPPVSGSPPPYDAKEVSG